jgi:hypothetical protein
VDLSKTILISLLSVIMLSQARAQESEVTEGKYETPAPTVLQFSEDELPREAVLPKLDSPKAVLSRKLSYEKRWQADLGAGWLLDEAFYNNQYVVVQGSYSWNEPSGVGVRYLMFGSGLSDYGKQFESDPNSAPPPDFDRTVGPKNGWMAFYERRMMYGKLSVSKWNVIPAFLTWNIEAGMLKYGARQLPIVGGSLSNRFFLKPQFALGFGIHAYVRQLVDPLSADLRYTPAPAEGEFKTNTKFSMAMDFGMSYLF